ncbi:MAG: hypothetical protein QXJ97_11510 [Desulfurococcaceae archaeon]
MILAIAKLHNAPIRIGIFRDKNVARVVSNLKPDTPVVKPVITAGVIKQNSFVHNYREEVYRFTGSRVQALRGYSEREGPGY